jgi:beta-N-acetylhexosaminidase
MPTRAFICGLSGPVLTARERSFLREADPWGVILFVRNVEDPQQLAAVTRAVRDALGRDAPVLVDQEGGRVQRLGPPHWPSYPPAGRYGRIYDQRPAEAVRAAYLGACLLAADLVAVGIDVDCLPVADIPVAGASQVIGDRAYGETPKKVAALARSVADGLLDWGVLPVLKHVPGHGRAVTDSHFHLPVAESDRGTLAATDFAAFRALADLPLAMTAHVIYAAIDPIAPATTSVTVVGEVIRDWMGFSGLLMSDDISMGALSGSLAQRSCAAIAAGCDVVLHCNGSPAEMEEVAAAVPVLEGRAAERATRALAYRRASRRYEASELRVEWAALLDAEHTWQGAST